jgi:peptidoglycan hydrolase-like protein with peptidoglycan-binding domain
MVESGSTLVEVATGEVSSSMQLTALATWEPEPTGTNLASGTVTSVAVSPGQEVGQGAALYAVDLRPVVIARGDTPAFRAMSSGTSGADVAQLQTMLTDLGYEPGAVDGRFSASTAAAVRAWQRSAGVKADGTVQPGDIIFVTDLPARVVLDGDVVHRGAQVGGGEGVLSRLPDVPAFTIPVSPTQSTAIAAGAEVELQGPDGEAWSAVVGARTSETDQVTLVLDGAADPVCAAACDSVPVTGETRLGAEVVLVPRAEGLRVPSSALKTRPDGSVVVIDDSGVEHQVQVGASARGVSLVEGVPAGTLVRVPAAG